MCRNVAQGWGDTAGCSGSQEGKGGGGERPGVERVPHKFVSQSETHGPMHSYQPLLRKTSPCCSHRKNYLFSFLTQINIRATCVTSSMNHVKHKVGYCATEIINCIVGINCGSRASLFQERRAGTELM